MIGVDFRMGVPVGGMSGMRDAMIEAVMSGNLVKVRQFVADGADVNLANRLGMTPLMVAAQWNWPGIVSFLLSKGADVVAQEHSSGCNALMFACLSGNPEVVRLVLKHGAPINSTNFNGRTALMTAAFCGITEVVRVLLKHGADPDAVDRFGATALTQASISGRTDVVNLLMAKGAQKTQNAVNTVKQRSLS